ncbi:MAG: hypothetical protein ACFFCY_02750 [Promethearchaeota archaeon]
MGKGGIILGIIALILGAGGFGFGIVTWMDQGKRDFWYVYNENIFTPPHLEYVTIPDLYVIVNLDAPATVHMLFTTSTRILPDPVTFADMIFYFWIDGVRLTQPFTRAGPYQGDATYQYYPVALQYAQTLSAGVHNISVSVITEVAGNNIRHSSLAVNRY